MTTLTTLSELPSDYAIALTENSVIKLQGEQADSYLHGQVTININALDEHTVRHCAHCDNKGKTWSVSYVARYNNALIMLMNKDSGQHSLTQLNKYGVFSKVDITDESSTYKQFFVNESLAHKVLIDYFDRLPEAPLTSVQSDAGIVFKSDVKHPGYHVVMNATSADTLIQKATACDCPIYAQCVFDAILIDSAIPSVEGVAINEYVPQMMNVQAINGIDFDKGCYMGQEVVARTRFLGKNKRAAYSFTLPMATKINVGDIVEKQLGTNWRRAGMVISKAELINETWFMAVLSNDTSEQDIHRLANHEDITCYPNSLPYSIEQAKSSLAKKRQ